MWYTTERVKTSTVATIKPDGDNCYCMARGEFEIYEGDTCDGFTPEGEEFLTDEEVKEILGDRKYHEKAEQGLIKNGEFIDDN